MCYLEKRGEIMIVYSTKLKVTDILRPNNFIRTLLRWRQHVDYQAFSETITWDGIDMNPLWEENGHILEVNYFEEEGIIAALFEQAPDQYGLWKTEIVFNINERTVCVRQHKDLDASMTERNNYFWAPSIVKYLMKGGYIAEEHGVPIGPDVMEWTESIKEDLLQQPVHSVCNVVIQGSPRFIDTIHIDKLALRLEGVARIFLKKTTDEPNTVTIYHHQNSVQVPDVKVYHGSAILDEDKVSRRIVDIVCDEMNLVERKPLDSWYGVQRKLLEKKMKKSLQERSESEELAEIAVHETAELEKRLQDMEQLANKYLQELVILQHELSILQSRMNHSESGTSLLYYGEEDDIYHDEIRTAVLKILEDVRQEHKPTDIHASNRIYDICDDIITHNAPRKKDAWDVYDSLDNLFSNYRHFSTRMQNELKSIGVTITKEGDHFKGQLGKQDRYTLSFPCSPSDINTGRRVVSDIKLRWFKK